MTLFKKHTRIFQKPDINHPHLQLLSTQQSELRKGLGLPGASRTHLTPGSGYVQGRGSVAVGVTKVAGEPPAWCLHQVRRETITPRSGGASFPTCLRAPNEYSLRCSLQTAAKKTGYGGPGMWGIGLVGPFLSCPHHPYRTGASMAEFIKAEFQV